MAGTMENIGGDARSAVKCAKRASWAPLCLSADRGTHGSMVEPLGCGEVHRLPDDDPTARPTRHQVP